jgi:predicted DNA-binding transcriptional regulator AlpA
VSNRYLKDQEIMSDLNIKARSTLLDLRKRDASFPKPVQLTPGRRVTVADEYEAWKASRPRASFSK